jgi:hypothetical protein
MNKKGLSRKGHIIFALSVIFLFFFIFWEHINMKINWVVYLIPLMLGAVFPDLIEIANSPRHRSKFHSKRAFKIILLYILPITIIVSFQISSKYFYLVAFEIGYLLHLSADVFTASGLPE